MATKRLTEVRKPQERPADSRFDGPPNLDFGFHVNGGTLKAVERLEKQMRKSAKVRRLRGH